MSSTEQRATSSPWLDDRRLEPQAPGPLPAHVQTLVIGGGLAGMSLAASLAAAGHEPLVLEARFPAWGASGRNAGFVLAEGPEVNALDASAQGRGEALRAAGLATRGRLLALSRRHPIGYRATGSLRLAHDQREAEAFRAAPQTAGVSVVPGADLPAPWNGGRWPAGRIDAGDAVIDPAALVHALRKDAEAEGAIVHTGVAVHELQAGPDGVRARTDGGTVRADRAVVATNAWTARLMPEVAIRPRRAQMLEATLDVDLRWTMPVYARGGADYWRSMSDGRVLLGGCRDAGGAEEETDRAQASPPVQAALDDLLRSLLPDGTYTITRRWAGIMGFTPDGAPFLGPTPSAPRIWLLAGFHGHGLGWAPGLAERLAAAIDEGPECIPPAFRIPRGEGRR